MGASAILFAIKGQSFFEIHPRLAIVGSYLGRISYSVYLFHLFVLETLGATLRSFPWPAMLAAYLVVTVAIASLMFAAVESPILAARPKFVD